MSVREETVKEALQAAESREIRVTAEPAEEELPVGADRIGGMPDVPEGFEWPRYETVLGDGEPVTVPLAFLGQFDLAGLWAPDLEGRLPQDGLLSIWYDLSTCPMGYGPEDRGGVRVFRFTEGEKLVRINAPEDLPEESVIDACRVTLQEEMSLPAFPDFEIPADWEEELVGSVYERSRELLGYDEDVWGFNTKFLGYPDTISEPMEWLCEAVAQGLSLYGEDEDDVLFDVEDEMLEAIDEGCGDWILLFQMGTIEGEDHYLEFGSAGHLYIWIRRRDLEAGCFDDVWAVLQSRD